MSHKVRITMRPDEEIEVGDAEYTDLSRQGLLVEDTPAENVPPATAAPATPKTPDAPRKTSTSKEN
ncbi:hypothetical protein [Streptomyces sp. NPDC048200]|uniref:hypothetical protein n=1 Tax=Streptomyces sp. NPDC048200 TaxID=3365512 RepID=UPI0037216B81